MTEDPRKMDVQRFHQNGWASISRITTDSELERLRALYDRLFVERFGESGGAYFDLAGPRGHEGAEALPQILGPEGAVPELRETLAWRNASRVASMFLGVPEEHLTSGSHMILKPARVGAETPWHQDEAYWPPDVTAHSLSAWIPLDDATVDSGCLHFISGSHTGDVLPHRHIGDDPTVHGLVTDFAEPFVATAVPVPAGGATFHHCRTLHYAGPNVTPRARRAWIVVFNGPSVPRAVPDSRPWQDEERAAISRAS